MSERDELQAAIAAALREHTYYCNHQEHSADCSCGESFVTYQGWEAHRADAVLAVALPHIEAAVRERVLHQAASFFLRTCQHKPGWDVPCTDCDSVANSLRMLASVATMTGCPECGKEMTIGNLMRHAHARHPSSLERIKSHRETALRAALADAVTSSGDEGER
jgi:hypothetical protein